MRFQTAAAAALYCFLDRTQRMPTHVRKYGLNPSQYEN